MVLTLLALFLLLPLTDLLVEPLLFCARVKLPVPLK
jgi:hypothetical protein